MAGPRRQWGWHQLTAEWSERFVAEASVDAGALVVDIGAGSGAITAPLVRLGARVVAVELHPGRARDLRRRFGDAVVVVQADARDLRLPRRPYQVVASPPFGVTTPMLGRLLQRGSRLLSARLILQEQAARRWAAYDAPGARRWSNTFDVSLGPSVPRRAFSPPPRVDARVLVVARRSARGARRRRYDSNR